MTGDRSHECVRDQTRVLVARLVLREEPCPHESGIVYRPQRHRVDVDVDAPAPMEDLGTRDVGRAVVDARIDETSVDRIVAETERLDCRIVPEAMLEVRVQPKPRADPSVGRRPWPDPDLVEPPRDHPSIQSGLSTSERIGFPPPRGAS